MFPFPFRYATNARRLLLLSFLSIMSSEGANRSLILLQKYRSTIDPQQSREEREKVQVIVRVCVCVYIRDHLTESSDIPTMSIAFNFIPLARSLSRIGASRMFVSQGHTRHEFVAFLPTRIATIMIIGSTCRSVRNEPSGSADSNQMQITLNLREI